MGGCVRGSLSQLKDDSGSQLRSGSPDHNFKTCIGLHTECGPYFQKNKNKIKNLSKTSENRWQHKWVGVCKEKRFTGEGGVTINERERKMQCQLPLLP